MLKSMTAYASNETEIGGMTIVCELRSVNHRYCDVSVKLPERWRSMESELRSQIAGRLNRGKVECVLSYKRPERGQQTFAVNMDAVKALLTTAADIENHMAAPLSFSALDVLAFPGIQQEPVIDSHQLSETIQQLLTQTLSQLISVREREGAQLKLLIEERCLKIQQLAAQADERMPVVLKNLRAKLTERVNDLVVNPDADRLEQELIFLTQKLDVAEELDRLNLHTREVLRVLQKDEPVGRRLDFLMQELNREANTLGSKSADKDISQISIELKVLIEQIREQVQNLE